MAALAYILAIAGLGAVPFTLQGPGVDPQDFEVTVFASGLNYPKGMLELPDGSLLVATSDPRAGSQGFYDSTGTILRLVDSDRDGAADGPGERLFTGLVGSLSGLKLAGPLVLVVSTGSRISILRRGDALDSPLAMAGRITFDLPGGWLHPPSDIAVRESPGAPGSHEVYFQLGSQANFAESTTLVAFGGNVGLTGTLAGDSIHRFILTDLGTSVAASSITRIATGLRNAAGIAFHPRSGDLWFQDNGIDGLADPNEPHSADELNVIPEEEVGGADVEDFGFPETYVRYRTGARVGSAGVEPLFAFQPLPDPATGSESEGPAEFAFSPPLFPSYLQDGVFVGFHGKFNLGGTQNEENALVFARISKGEYFHLIAPRQAGVGHLDGLLSAGDSLYVSDLSSSGSLSTGAGKGVIYKIRARSLPLPLFIRGDSNTDGAVNVSDAVFTLGHLFLRAPAPPCLDSADANDDGELDVSDPVATVLALFAGGVTLPPPAGEPGPDPTADSLGCAQ